jgi:hypothetical protein
MNPMGYWSMEILIVVFLSYLQKEEKYQYSIWRQVTDV